MKSKTLVVILAIVVILIILYFAYKSSDKYKAYVEDKSSNQIQPNEMMMPTIKRTVSVYNPFPQEYLNSFENPELVRTSGVTKSSNKTYIYECRRTNSDGTVTVTSGYSDKPSGNCSIGFTEKILKILE